MFFAFFVQNNKSNSFDIKIFLLYNNYIQEKDEIWYFMVNKKKLLFSYNLCESCSHIMHEKKIDIKNCNLVYSDEQNNSNFFANICEVCGQPLFPGFNVDNKDINMLISAINNKSLKVIFFIAPSVRVALGDEFGFPAGTNVIGKTISALKQLGAFKVFDMNSAADFTIVEEANEFKNRLEENKNLPMFTSCCPGWVGFAKKMYPKYLNNLSTCKSPQQMFGALLNTYFADIQNIKSTDMFIVSVVPCFAKKIERLSCKNSARGYDVDLAITTTELAKVIKDANIDFANLKDSAFDDFFGSATGAGAIFGNTGGVMEAMLRSANDQISNKNSRTLVYNTVRGLDGIRRATIQLGDKNVNIAVVMGLKNVNIVMDELKSDPHKYDLIEVMACDGGCIGGPGQPQIKSNENKNDILSARIKGLYDIEIKCAKRKAHQNPALQKIYRDFFGSIGSQKAEVLLHRKF